MIEYIKNTFCYWRKKYPSPILLSPKMAQSPFYFPKKGDLIFILFCVAVLTHSWRQSFYIALDIKKSTIWEIELWYQSLKSIFSSLCWSDFEMIFIQIFSIFPQNVSLQHFFSHITSWNKHHTVIQHSVDKAL